MSTDIRTTLNLISEVIVNRPPALREFDQIYMRAGDMMMHVDHIASIFHDRDMVFIGDGDATGLTLMHLYAKDQLNYGPRSIHILDFDERMVGSVRRFAKLHGYEKIVNASYYNVREGLPPHMIGKFNAFHTNPPYGKSNGGRSIDAFVRRGVEACGTECCGCVILADDDSLPWTQDVLASVQQSIVAGGFLITEMRPKTHRYHLDDAPDLTSCTLLLKRQQTLVGPVRSLRLTREHTHNFYGAGLPLTVSRVKDRTAAGRFPSRDHEIQIFDDAPDLWEDQ